MADNPSDRKTVPPDYVKAGTILTSLSLQLSQELNRRKVPHRLVVADSHSSALYAPPHASREAAEVLEEIKRKNPRIRL